jgi:hypothetical protein
MEKDDIANAVAVFSSLYAKRFLEAKYDAIMVTEFGNWLKSLSPRVKYAIEALAYMATATAGEQFKADNPFKTFLKEVATDMPAELAKRMINGQEHLPVSDGDKKPVVIDVEAQEIEYAPAGDGGKKSAVIDVEAVYEPEEIKIMNAFLKLRKETLAIVMQWVAEVRERDRGKLMKTLSSFNDDDIVKIAELSAEARWAMLGMRAASELQKTRLGSMVGKDLNDLGEKFLAKLEERAKKRKGQ